MAINRYDQPSQAQFINTYSPVPFDQMLKIGELKQAKVEKGLNQEDALRQSIASMKVAPGDEKLYNSKIAEAYKILDAGTQYGVGTQDHLNAVRKARNFLVEDPLMRQMSQNYPAYAQAAEELRKAKAEFGANSPAVYKLERDLQDFNKGDGSVTGTQYLMNKNGVGNLVTSGVGKPADIQPEIAKYLEPVKADMIGTEGLDQSGMFKLGTKVSQITPEKLGSVLGISFKAVVEGGKKKIVVDRENINPPADLLSTPGGMFLMQKAEQYAGNSGGKITVEEAYKQLYADDAIRQISAKTSKQSEYTMDENQFALASYKKKLEDQQSVITTPFLLGEKASEINSFSAVQKAQDGIGTNLNTIQAKRDEYKKQNNVAEGIGNPGAIDADGRSVAMVLAEFGAEEQQEKDKLTSLDNLVANTRADKGIPDKWKITDDFTEKQLAEFKEEAWSKAQSVSKSTKEGGQDFSEIQKKYEQLYNEKLASKSENYKKLNQGLEENAKARLVEVGITNFPTVSSEKTMQDIVFKFTNEGAGSKSKLGGGALALKDAKTGEEYTDKDYQKMSRSSEAKYKPEVMGFFYDTKEGWPQIMVRPKNDKGELLPAAKMNAPAGTEDIFITAGKIDAGEVMVNKALANIATKADRTGSLGGGVDVKVLLPTTQAYNPSGATYEATFTNFTNGERSTVVYDTREELVAKYIQYIQAKANFEETGKVPAGM